MVIYLESNFYWNSQHSNSKHLYFEYSHFKEWYFHCCYFQDLYFDCYSFLWKTNLYLFANFLHSHKFLIEVAILHYIGSKFGIGCKNGNFGDKALSRFHYLARSQANTLKAPLHTKAFPPDSSGTLDP